jgi:hypothetical protein
MLTRVDEQLREEAERFRLRFGCEACVHWQEDAESCANGYPNDAHKRITLARVETLSFCKEFELA